jgi:carboxypeptidase Taq
MAVHESQSRLWENQVARSHGFWNHFEPRFRAAFPDQMAGVSSEAMYLAVNAVTPTLIRVDSDEVTYNLHILLRFDIERRLFSGEIKVEDLPRAWKIASLQLLGLLPENDREGVLQDVHWSCGDFGYFPSYTLGNMFAAQLWYRALELMPGMEYDFACGDFTKFLGWLRQEVHSKGCQYTLPELVRRSTGAELSPKPLLRYLKERYGPLYLHEG